MKQHDDDHDKLCAPCALEDLVDAKWAVRSTYLEPFLGVMRDLAQEYAEDHLCTVRQAAAVLLGSYGDFCEQCGGITFGYMLTDELWARVTAETRERILCLQCVEQRLGRRIMVDDLAPCALNEWFSAEQF